MEAHNHGLGRPAGRGLFSLSIPTSPALAPLTARVSPWLDRLLALDGINAIYDRVAPGGTEGFIERTLGDLGIGCRVAKEELGRIPVKGPLVVVANHPFGAIEGIALAVLLRKVRPDVRVMANFLLGRIPELRQLFICVDPFGKEQSALRNIRPFRQAMRWLAGGGALAVFPAGEVAHLDLRQRQVVEPPWSPTIAGLIRRSGASVVPVFFDGCNSPLFQLIGLVHPRLRTAMLPRELMGKCGSTLDVRVGTVIPPRRLAGFDDDRQVIEYLRERMLLLRHRSGGGQSGPDQPTPWGDDAAPEPVVAAQPRQLLAAEVSKLPDGQLLAEGGEFQVYLASAEQAPHVLREIGRLRELTYRATGEGTGKSIDLDAFDQWYSHLFVWDATGEQVVGAYRLGQSDRILRSRGPAGLYTSTLFELKRGLLNQLNPALELGRAFVRAEFQRSFAPLMLLWKGIARFVCLHPRYRILFGPVSISNDYRLASRQLMVEFLRSNHLAADLTPHVRARNPFRSARLGALERLAFDPTDLDDVIADLEPDQKGMPVLLRQYLKLGARFLAFNVDRDFGHAIDALMVVDLTQTEERILTRYMGREAMTHFLQFHRATSN